MNVLEKILEEIEKRRGSYSRYSKSKIGKKSEKEISERITELGYIEEIIRSHMNHSGNDTEMGDWISVEEKLPEEDDGKRYIVTDEHGLVRSEMEYGHPMDGNREVCFHKWDDEYWGCYRPKVIAWQPLPEPYKSKKTIPVAGMNHIMSRFTKVE